MNFVLSSPSSLATLTLWRREMVRFFRQRNRVIGAMATPLVFWLLLGFGLNQSFTVGDAKPPQPRAGSHESAHEALLSVGESSGIGYLEYFYPGTVVLILLFTAIFSTISVIEDRREGFLQAVLVAPIHQRSIVFGKVLGGASIAMIQGVIFLIIWPLVGAWPGIASMLGAMMVMFMLAMCLTALSLCLAWPMDSTAGFHALMNLLLMPMWFLSGAVFPVSNAPVGMRVVMWLNPLTYGQAAFSSLLRGEAAGLSAPISLAWATGLLAVFTILAVITACWVVTKRREGIG